MIIFKRYWSKLLFQTYVYLQKTSKSSCSRISLTWKSTYQKKVELQVVGKIWDIRLHVRFWNWKITWFQRRTSRVISASTVQTNWFCCTKVFIWPLKIETWARTDEIPTQEKNIWAVASLPLKPKTCQEPCHSFWKGYKKARLWTLQRGG